MRIQIPDIGDLITLTEPWTFKLQHEYRNANFIKAIKGIQKPKSPAYPKIIKDKYDAIQKKYNDKGYSSGTSKEPDGRYYILYRPERTRYRINIWDSGFDNPEEVKIYFTDEETAAYKQYEKDMDVYYKIDAIGTGRYREGVKTQTFTFPSGSVLVVDRIYIRKGAADYSSITFRIQGDPFDKKRFWAKLHDVNNIVGEIKILTPEEKVKAKPIPTCYWFEVEMTTPGKQWKSKCGYLHNSIDKENPCPNCHKTIITKEDRKKG